MKRPLLASIALALPLLLLPGAISAGPAAEDPAAPVQVLIYGSIGWEVTSAGVLQQVIEAGEKPILVRMNSGGGDVFEAYAIFNAFKNHTPGVTVEIDGLAASAASYIAMAAGKIRMAENAIMMIHNPTSFTGGDAEAMRSQAELLDKIKVSLVAAYQSRTGLPEAELHTMLDDETYLSAAEALEKKFIDEIFNPVENLLKFHARAFRKPDRVAAFLAKLPQLGNLQAKLGASEQRAVSAETKASTAENALKTFIDAAGEALNLSAESLTKLKAGDASTIPVAIEHLAGKKAVAIIAGQGAPPVPSKPGGPASKKEELAEALAAAAKLTDPRARAQAFAAARARIDAAAEKRLAGRN